MIDEELAEKILDDFNCAVDVDDTVWYNRFMTLYERILDTIDEHMKESE